VLLLRSTIAALRTAGHDVGLLAPAAVGAALVGSGASEVRELLPWDGPEMAQLLAGSPPPAPFAGRLASFAAAIAFTRSADLIDCLGGFVPRVIVRDPEPARGHASLWLAEAARELGAVAAPLPPDLRSTPEEEAAARSLLARLPPRFLALHPGSGSPAKNWPAERFGALGAVLSPSRPWLLVSGPADEAAAATLGTEPDAVHARSLPARVLGALLAHAGLFVGHDSGVSHLAAAFGAPVLALFGPTDPAVWAPIGRRVRTLRSPDHSPAGLSLDAVVAQAREVR
jgi:ADP-heptose:LPS heptosyltransferase